MLGIKKWLNKVNLDLRKFRTIRHSGYRRKQLLNHIDPIAVIDVGANVGQFAMDLINLGYRSPIHSIEPYSEAFDALEKRAIRVENWHTYHLGLSDKPEVHTLNISANSQSSSFLELSEKHKNEEENIFYVGKQEVRTDTLDSFLISNNIEANGSYLKIDAQGYEHRILDGAIDCIKKFKLVELEVALTPMYKGEETYQATLDRMDSLGFVPVFFDTVHGDLATGITYQVDIIFQNFGDVYQQSDK